MNNYYIVGGVIVILLIAIILFLVLKKKEKFSLPSNAPTVWIYVTSALNKQLTPAIAFKIATNIQSALGTAVNITYPTPGQFLPIPVPYNMVINTHVPSKGKYSTNNFTFDVTNVVTSTLAINKALEAI